MWERMDSSQWKIQRDQSQKQCLRWYKTQKYSHIRLPLVGFSLRVCLFVEILRRIENWEEKSGEKVVLVDVWLGGGEKKNGGGPRCFLLT